MNEAIALKTRSRSIEGVCHEIYERHRTLHHLRGWAAEYMNYDQPTIIVSGPECHVIHSVEAPKDLVELIRQEAAEIQALEREVVLRRQAGER